MPEMPSTTDQPAQSASSWMETVVVVLGAIGVAFLVQWLLIKPYQVPSGSMLPTIHTGQRILADRIGDRFGDPENGQIIVFHPSSAAETSVPCAEEGAMPCLRPARAKLGKAYVKRVVGEPGDRLSVVRGHVVRNGRPVDEPYARSCAGPTCNLPTFVVPAGTYYLMGDNRGNSSDSRYWGPVPRSFVVGRAVATYWPPKRIGGVG